MLKVDIMNIMKCVICGHLEIYDGLNINCKCGGKYDRRIKEFEGKKIKSNKTLKKSFASDKRGKVKE